VSEVTDREEHDVDDTLTDAALDRIEAWWTETEPQNSYDVVTLVAEVRRLRDGRVAGLEAERDAARRAASHSLGRSLDLEAELAAARHNYHGAYEAVTRLADVLGANYAQDRTPAAVMDDLIGRVEELVAKVEGRTS
jgi:hypothetical protein